MISYRPDVPSGIAMSFNSAVVEIAFDYYMCACSMRHHKANIAAVLCTLSIEIAFKSFLVQPVEHIGQANELYDGFNGRKLDVLYGELPEKISPFLINLKDMALLKQYSQFFIKGRYAYEACSDSGVNHTSHYELMKLAGSIILNIVYLYQMNGCDDKFIKDFDIDSFYEKNVQYVLR